MKRLVRGQRIKITDVTSANLLEVRLRFQSSNNLRIDACCFGLDADGRLSDDRYLIFYNQNASPENSLTLRGGAETPTFHIDLSLIPNHVRRLVFAITVGGEGVLSNLGSSHLVLVANGRPAAAYNFSGADVESEKALMVSEVYYKDTWRFAAVCQGFNGGLAALLKHFGGEIVEEESRADIPGGNISLTSPIQSQVSVPSTPAVLSMPQPPAPPAPPTISPGRSCIRCAKEPGFLGGLTGFNLQTRRCAKCEREVQSTLSNFIQMFRSYASGVVLTESQWQELRQVLDRERISWQEGMAAARTEAEELIASTLKMIASDNAIMPEEERYLHQLHTALLISPQVAQASLKELEQLKELIRLRLGFLPTVIPTVHLDSDEQCYLETDATYLRVCLQSHKCLHLLCE